MRWVGVFAASACASSSGAELPSGRVVLRLTEVDGATLSLATLRGRPVLVTVMTTWADFALLEVPRFRALYEAYRGRIEIVCVALDPDVRMVRIFRDTFAIPYRVAVVDDAAGFTGRDGPFGPVSVIPTSILIDAEGVIAARMDGMWPDGVLEQAVQKVATSIGRD